MARGENEEFRVLFLDRKNILVADEVQSRGTIDHTPVYPREIVKCALELSATAIILVHNHPSGDPTPSKADIDMTRDIIFAAKALGITQMRLGEIVRGRRAITPDTALRLARYFGTSAEFWTGMQAHYDLEVARDAVGEAIEKQVLPRAA